MTGNVNESVMTYCNVFQCMEERTVIMKLFLMVEDR